jgi:DNA mismatch repair protein MutS
MRQPHETPMMSQYLAMKKDHPDAILLFRMGDFFETFYEDAVTAARVLGIALTSRAREGERRIPLAGVPHHAVDTYIARLVRAGHKVAVCDQVEDPREARGLVKRRVVEVITPGTVTSALLLEDKENNYLMAFACEKGACGLAWTDLSTGEFRVAEAGREHLFREIVKIRPSEVLYPKDSVDEATLAAIRQSRPGIALTPLDDYLFLHEAGGAMVCDHFKVATLDGFGCQGMPLADPEEAPASHIPAGGPAGLPGDGNRRGVAGEPRGTRPAAS